MEGFARRSPPKFRRLSGGERSLGGPVGWAGEGWVWGCCTQARSATVKELQEVLCACVNCAALLAEQRGHCGDVPVRDDVVEGVDLFVFMSANHNTTHHHHHQTGLDGARGLSEPCS